MGKVVKSTFDLEQLEKDEAFLKLTPFQRWEVALRVRKSMRKENVSYSYQGQKVKVIRNVGTS